MRKCFLLMAMVCYIFFSSALPNRLLRRRSRIKASGGDENRNLGVINSKINKDVQVNKDDTFPDKSKKDAFKKGWDEEEGLSSSEVNAKVVEVVNVIESDLEEEKDPEDTQDDKEEANTDQNYDTDDIDSKDNQEKSTKDWDIIKRVKDEVEEMNEDDTQYLEYLDADTEADKLNVEADGDDAQADREDKRAFRDVSKADRDDVQADRDDVQADRDDVQADRDDVQVVIDDVQEDREDPKADRDDTIDSDVRLKRTNRKRGDPENFQDRNIKEFMNEANSENAEEINADEDSFSRRGRNIEVLDEFNEGNPEVEESEEFEVTDEEITSFEAQDDKGMTKDKVDYEEVVEEDITDLEQTIDKEMNSGQNIKSPDDKEITKDKITEVDYEEEVEEDITDLEQTIDKEINSGRNNNTPDDKGITKDKITEVDYEEEVEEDITDLEQKIDKEMNSGRNITTPGESSTPEGRRPKKTFKPFLNKAQKGNTCNKKDLMSPGKFEWKCVDNPKFGDYCRLMCKDDSLISNQVYTTCTPQGWIGEKVSSSISCKPLQCPDPTKVYKGKAKWTCVKPKSVCPLSGVDRLGEVCEVECPPSKDGSDSSVHISVCTTEGWAPKLNHISCPGETKHFGKTGIRGTGTLKGDKTKGTTKCFDPENPQNGEWKCVGEEIQRTCVLTCNKGYGPDGDSLVNCADKVWDSDPTKIKCAPDKGHSCEYLPGAEFGSWQCNENECELKCNRGYNTILKVTATCVNNAWCTRQPGIGCRTNTGRYIESFGIGEEGKEAAKGKEAADEIFKESNDENTEEPVSQEVGGGFETDAGTEETVSVDDNNGSPKLINKYPQTPKMEKDADGQAYGEGVIVKGVGRPASPPNQKVGNVKFNENDGMEGISADLGEIIRPIPIRNEKMSGNYVNPPGNDRFDENPSENDKFNGNPLENDRFNGNPSANNRYNGNPTANDRFNGNPPRNDRAFNQDGFDEEGYKEVEGAIELPDVSVGMKQDNAERSRPEITNPIEEENGFMSVEIEEDADEEEEGNQKRSNRANESDEIYITDTEVETSPFEESQDENMDNFGFEESQDYELPQRIQFPNTQFNQRRKQFQGNPFQMKTDKWNFNQKLDPVMRNFKGVERPLKRRRQILSGRRNIG